MFYNDLTLLYGLLGFLVVLITAGTVWTKLK